MYSIFVDGKIIAENVLKCDLDHKIEMIRAACNLFEENRYSLVTYTLNTPETIA